MFPLSTRKETSSSLAAGKLIEESLESRGRGCAHGAECGIISQTIKLIGVISLELAMPGIKIHGRLSTAPCLLLMHKTFVLLGYFLCTRLSPLCTGGLEQVWDLVEVWNLRDLGLRVNQVDFQGKWLLLDTWDTRICLLQALQKSKSYSGLAQLMFS